MIGFVDEAPRIEPHGDGFLVTVDSGGTETRFMFTRHALVLLGHKISAAHAKARVAELDAEPTPFPARRRKRQ